MLRSEAAVRVPAHVDAAKYAPILCAGMTVYNSMRRMAVAPGSTIGIQGLGGLGHLAIQYANKFGYRVVAISRNSDKEKFARELGAHEYIDSSMGDAGEQLQKLGGASLVVATAPTAEVITPLLKGLGILGKLLILSGTFLKKDECLAPKSNSCNSSWQCSGRYRDHGKNRMRKNPRVSND